jgi:hypothetical protein
MRIEFHNNLIFSADISLKLQFSCWFSLLISSSSLAPAKCARKVFFLSTQILCGFLFIFKLFPLSHFPPPSSWCVDDDVVWDLSEKWSWDQLVFLSFSFSSSNSIIAKQCGYKRRRWKISLQLILIYYRTTFISHSARTRLFEFKTPSPVFCWNIKCRRDENDKMEAKTKRNPWHLPSWL